MNTITLTLKADLNPNAPRITIHAPDLPTLLKTLPDLPTLLLKILTLEPCKHGE